MAQLNSASDLPAGRQVSGKGKMYYVYVIKSLKDGRLYKGMTQTLEKRIDQHNKGENRSTKSYKPWKLVYSKGFVELQEARNYEKYLKSGVGRAFLKTINT